MASLDSEARKTVVLVEEKIEELDSNIHKTIDQLCEESPQKRIPPEVLIEIFLYAYSTNNEHQSFLSPSYTKNVPWTLRSVCSGWRHAALSEYQLWNNLVFRFDRKGSRAAVTHPRLQERRLAFLNHSIVVPLLPVSIAVAQVSCSTGIPRWFNEGIVLPNLPRLGCLHLTMVPVAIRGTLRELPESLPLLRTLILDAIYDKEHRAIVSGLLDNPFFHGNPVLQELKVYSRAFRQLFLNQPLTTWHHLACLEILGENDAAVDLIAAAGFLRRCPNVSTCRLRLRFYAQENPNRPSSPIVLSHLRVLSLRFDHFEAFLAYSNICPLIAPLLTDLKVTYYDARSEVGCMVPWMSASGCSLQRLSFYGDQKRQVSVSRIASDELLLIIPDIRHLDMRDTFYPDETLQRLGDGYLPRLLSLALCGNLRTARTVAGALELRKGTGADCMQAFSLYINDSGSHRRELLQCVERAKACDTIFRIHDYHLGWLDEQEWYPSK